MNQLPAEKISVFALVLLITGAIDSIRNLPTMALFGSSLIFFILASALVFLIPVALVSAELSASWPKEEGGIYSWVRNSLGENMAFFTIWLQWVNTMVWCPSILSFIAGTLAYLINPQLAQNKFYLIAVILIVFWLLTLIGLKGLRASARFASICALVGMIIPMGFIIFLGGLWLIQGQHISIDLSTKSMLPQWTNSQSWVPLTAIITAFLGMELAAVHVRNIANPQRNFPRAMFFSVLLILITMVFGSLAIAMVLPKNEINLVDGVMQAFTNFLQAYHLAALLPVVVCLLLLGSLGSMINWIISPAKGLLLSADHGFLPRWFYQKNKHDIASRILLTQAVVVTCLCSAFLLFPNINAIYWLFTDLSTELYILMYVFMFIAAWRIKMKFPNLKRPFAIPGKRVGYYLTCMVGLLACMASLVVGFIPPESSMEVGGASHFRLVFSLGIILMLLPAVLLIIRKHMYFNSASAIEARSAQQSTAPRHH